MDNLRTLAAAVTVTALLAGCASPERRTAGDPLEPMNRTIFKVNDTIDRTIAVPIAKALLWLILLCGLVVILTGVVPMTPVFGTSGQHFLYLTHRYGGITLACAVVLHLLNLMRR